VDIPGAVAESRYSAVDRPVDRLYQGLSVVFDTVYVITHRHYRFGFDADDFALVIEDHGTARVTALIDHYI
jgi:hypothetical protein